MFPTYSRQSFVEKDFNLFFIILALEYYKKYIFPEIHLTAHNLLRHFCSLKQEKENERRQVEQMSARFTEPTDPISGMTAEESLTLEHAEEEAVRHDVEKRHKRVVKSRETERLGCYRFEDWAFLFSPLTPLLTQLNKCVPGYRQ